MRFKVGDRVRVKTYGDLGVLGEVIGVATAKTITYDYFTAYTVKYDTPVRRDCNGSIPYIIGGQHLACDLEKYRSTTLQARRVCVP